MVRHLFLAQGIVGSSPTAPAKSIVKLAKMQQEISITVENLSHRYGSFQALDNISFEVKKGEIFGLLGPNGAGKTTTLSVLETLYPPSDGQIMIEGLNVKKQVEQLRRIIGILPQEAGFFDHLRLNEILDLFSDLYRQPRRGRKLLENVQLKDKARAYIEHLSGGQKQRFSIALALVNRPKVLFLDEPTTGLDPQSRRYIWDLIGRINRSQTTVVLTTHHMEEAELLCHRLAILDHGQIIALGSPKELIAELLKKGFEAPQAVKPAATLEDVFINLTGRSLRE